ncbi:hypothetical protein [Bradyrhizobium sp. CCGUVB14]|uniref:hypothetical protein n=1 Tax=Bradyrhizobium sp. CCGUVB14 TaxID=2949628 RepID=UPI0020B2FE16|nr:hypothetical protein [Bradyrhizobium sp. CCGUVB14]MCP3446745.1 hypothetical protein [Bradyrhizobium sp. CCGUVB14]
MDGTTNLVVDEIAILPNSGVIADLARGTARSSTAFESQLKIHRGQHGAIRRVSLDASRSD